MMSNQASIVKEPMRDFAIAKDNHVDDENDLPHLNKTSSIVVNEQFRVKNTPPIN